MKKVKIMLTAITVFAVVGGALAFKAKSAGFHLYQCNNSQPTGQCVKIDGSNTYTTTTLAAGGTEKSSATVTNADPTDICANACPDIVTVKVEQQ
jgi:hypothetical protein